MFTQLPADIADIVQGVFGLDDRPQAKAHFQRRARTGIRAMTPDTRILAGERRGPATRVQRRSGIQCDVERSHSNPDSDNRLPAQSMQCIVRNHRRPGGRNTDLPVEWE